MVMRINSVVYSAENVNRLRGEAKKHADFAQLTKNIGQMKPSDVANELNSNHPEKDLTDVLGLFLSGVKGGKINYSA